MQLEASGRPTVVVTTTRFEALTREVASTLGLPDLRVLVVEHPLGGTDATTIERWADASIEALVALLVSP